MEGLPTAGCQRRKPQARDVGPGCQSSLQHLFSRSVPAVSRWLDASMAECSGGEHMPRVHSIDGGACERLVVSPGHEDQGLIQMIAGESGHFLSPYYRAGHDAWARGKPKPLLPGPTRHRLSLVPGGA